MKIFNLNADEWDRTEEREGWRFKDAWVGAHTDAELIGASMYEVEPGNKQGPFHTHHANEEWAIVLRGEPTLRTHEGEQLLRQGDVVAFPRGKEGAHALAGLGARPGEGPAVFDDAVLPKEETVHEDLDVREGRDECLRHVGYPGRIATVDGDHAARRVMRGDARGIAAAPRVGVRACELLDLLPIVRHRLRRP